MEGPSVAGFPPDLLAAAREIAKRLGAHGHRGWIVGGAVRDLALGIPPHDVDMASAARPEEVEALFERTFAVGRAFGTIVVHLGEVDVQVTTFRTESGYSDARRPDRVRYGRSPEEDAERRDFTCNALYLDPLDGTVLDPTGGLRDLRAGLLRCVGDATERIAEDGLRIVRMARFAAAHRLGVDPDTLRAAREGVEALRGVSAERVLAELARIATGGGAPEAIRILAEVGALGRALPGIEALGPPEVEPAGAYALRVAVLARLRAVDLELLLAVLLSPLGPTPEPGTSLARAALEGLRAPRRTCEAVLELWRLERALRAPPATRAQRIRLVREPAFPRALALARAWWPVLAGGRPGDEPPGLRELAELHRSLAPAELHPEPWLTSADLARAALPRGPLWSEILNEAEDLQLEGRLASRPDALRWLADRIRNLAP